MTKKIIAIISLILIITSIIPMKSKAIEEVNGARIYSKGLTDALLIRNGIGIHTYIAVYSDGNKEYPAYCLNRELAGVELGDQTVDINSLVTDAAIWRTVVNGYPYKSISELGCETEDEAYLATKQAVYCTLTNRDPNTYSAVGEAGERTLQALRNIVSNAENSQETKIANVVTIQKEGTEWKQDEKENDYLYKDYWINTNSSMQNYQVDIEKINENLPEGFKEVNR